MGTNFYVRGHRNDMDPEAHIGKRSAAGAYCWDCGITLCKTGEKGIHFTSGSDKWHEACPKCGKEPVKESWDESSGGRELGFNKSEPQKKAGVRSCSSFTWAISEAAWQEILNNPMRDGECPNCHRIYDDKDKVVENEYGDLFTLEEFAQILEECPVRYNDSRGQHFS